MSTNQTEVIKDLKAKTIMVSREFNAPVENVWRAFTESELLDQWWAPAPWRAETKSMDFSVGGYWLYAMVSPENQRHYGRMNYLGIDPHKSIDIEDVFCDENGNANTELPTSAGRTLFTPTANGTRVEFQMKYNSEEEVLKMIEMGFEQGITICFEQLSELINNKRI